MRSRALAAATAFSLFAVAPAAAQVSATIHIGPFGGHGAPVYVREPVREVVVIPYDYGRHGDYRRYGRDWRPVTVYVLGNRYYAQPYRNARPVVVYSYRNTYFLEPRDRDWGQYRSRYERDYWNRRDDRRDDRYDRRDDRRDDRYDRRDDRWDDRRDVRRNDGPGRGNGKAKGNNGRGNGRRS